MKFTESKFEEKICGESTYHKGYLDLMERGNWLELSGFNNFQDLYENTFVALKRDLLVLYFCGGSGCQKMGGGEGGSTVEGGLWPSYKLWTYWHTPLLSSPLSIISTTISLAVFYFHLDLPLKPAQSCLGVISLRIHLTFLMKFKLKLLTRMTSFFKKNEL